MIFQIVKLVATLTNSSVAFEHLLHGLDIVILEHKVFRSFFYLLYKMDFVRFIKGKKHYRSPKVILIRPFPLLSILFCRNFHWFGPLKEAYNI